MLMDPILWFRFVWLRLFPELALFDGSQSRKSAWRRANGALCKHWPFWLVTPVAVIGALSMAILAVVVLPDLLGIHLQNALPPYLLIVILLTSNASALTVIWLFRHDIRQSLREQLRQTGVCHPVS